MSLKHLFEAQIYHKQKRIWETGGKMAHQAGSKVLATKAS